MHCYATVITLTSSAGLRYIIRHVPTISRSQMHYLYKVCQEYTSIHSDILIILFVCLHMTYCNFLPCNKADHFSHVQHLCIHNACTNETHVMARTHTSLSRSIYLLQTTPCQKSRRLNGVVAGQPSAISHGIRNVQPVTPGPVACRRNENNRSHASMQYAHHVALIRHRQHLRLSPA